MAKGVGPERAKEIVAAKFTEAITQVVSVEALETATPMIYDVTCTYRRTEFGKICLYVAKGQVDTDPAKILTSQRRRRSPPRRRFRDRVGRGAVHQGGPAPPDEGYDFRRRPARRSTFRPKDRALGPPVERARAAGELVHGGEGTRASRFPSA